MNPLSELILKAIENVQVMPQQIPDRIEGITDGEWNRFTEIWNAHRHKSPDTFFSRLLGQLPTRDFREFRFNNLSLENFDFTNCIFVQAEFDNCQISGATFQGAQLQEATVRGSDLRRAKFYHARLTNTEFIDVIFDAETNFSVVDDCKGFRIDRYALECLGPERGGLTVGNRMVMQIVDDVATLRQQFGGVWRVIHSVAMLLFLMPYLCFVAYQLTRTYLIHPFDNDKTVSLLEALMRFILRGQEWQSGWVPVWATFGTFVLYLLYNVARATLFAKTMLLERQQEVTELPAKFSLVANRKWRVLYNITRIGGYFAVSLAIWNTIYFLLTTEIGFTTE